MPRHRLRPTLLVVAAQAVLTLAALELCSVRTASEDSLKVSSGGEIHGFDATFVGYPVPWVESWQRFHRPWRHDGPERVDPVEEVGRNPAVPPLMLAIALTFPPVAAGTVGRVRRRVRGEPRLPLSRPARALRVALLASAAALFTAWFARETAGWTVATPWSARPPGKWVDDTPGWSWFVGEVATARNWVRDRVPETDRWLAPTWPAATRSTLTVLLIATAVGCLTQRPWRRTLGAAGPPARDRDPHRRGC